jgi:hypothetical protein
MPKHKRKIHRRLGVVVGIFSLAAIAVTAGWVALSSQAATYAVTAEAETATQAGRTTRCSQAGASGGIAQRFGSTACSQWPVPAGQAIGWGDVHVGWGGAWHRLHKLPDGSWLRINTHFFAPGRSDLHIHHSTDNARTWTFRSYVTDGQRLVDNGTLYTAPNGDLLMSGRNLIDGSNYRISQWRSTDQGKTWQREADIRNSSRGAWEPFYYTAAGNKTVVMWSDEGRGPSQVIVQRVSTDNGRTWGGESWVVSDGQNGRPGMSVVSKMTNGQYILVYEICGTQACNVFRKISGDGLGWPGGIGSRVPGAVCGPYVTSLTNGRVVVTACRTTETNHTTPIVYSDDFGISWKTNSPAFTDAGIYGHWPSIHQSGPDEIVAVSQGRLRFGTIGPR